MDFGVNLCVIVPEAEDRADLSSPWFVFNDFVVRNVSEEDALSFAGNWKVSSTSGYSNADKLMMARLQVPAVVYLERIDENRQVVDLSRLPSEIDLSILSRDTSISVYVDGLLSDNHLLTLSGCSNRNKSLIKHKCLRFEELPKPGTLVAIDAEFVQMQQEETEFRSDGTKKVLRPARLSLARVSVLRGDGAMQGVPFIDDHIHTSETIVDYLTEFSGINCEQIAAVYFLHSAQLVNRRRSGSSSIQIYVDAFEISVQEIALVGRPRVYIHRSRPLQGLPYHK